VGGGGGPRPGGGGRGAGAQRRLRRRPLRRTSCGPPPPKGEDLGHHGLDATWDRKLRTARIEPDFTLDLHGYTLDAAHARLEGGLTQAKAMGARLVLAVTGKPRTVEAADRGSKRGAIRAKVIDWLAAGPHASSIAAIRKAHRRHGGDGALYIVLRRGDA
jgi:DNA-nicking Smr family endonuclease